MNARDRVAALLFPPLIAIAALASGVAHAAPDERADASAYIDAIMVDEQVAACSAKAPQVATRMTAAHAPWRAAHAEEIARGAKGVESLYPRMGATEREQRKSARDLFELAWKDELAADPQRACTTMLYTIANGVPVDFRGQTRTGEELRRDIYQQATIAATCKQPEAIDATVVDASAANWSERWTITGCGTSVELTIRFTPTADGGTDFAIARGGRAK